MQERRAIKTTKSKLPPRGWKKNRGLTVYKPQPPSRFRRFLRLIFNGWTLSLFAILLLFAFLTLTYYWFDFSDKIDRRLLSGEVFTPTAGIYSAPKTLRNGEDISLQGLIDYL